MIATAPVRACVGFRCPPSPRPPAKATRRSPPPAAAPAHPGESTADPARARWLLQQDGQPDAIALPLAQVVHAATGRQVIAFDPANPADASPFQRFGASMDRVLPQMNRPDSPAHAAALAGRSR